MLEWRIDKNFTVTVDNTSFNNVTILYLKNVVKDWTTVILSNMYLHVRCCTHIVNLIMYVMDWKKFSVSVVKIRNAIRFVRLSPSRQLAFKKCVEKLYIKCKKLMCLDVTTWWNLTNLMLKVTKKFEVFIRISESNSRYISYFMEVDSKREKQKSQVT